MGMDKRNPSAKDQPTSVGATSNSLPTCTSTDADVQERHKSCSTTDPCSRKSLSRNSPSGKMKHNRCNSYRSNGSPYARSSSEESDEENPKKRVRRVAANTRERNRMHAVNNAFDMLRELVPAYPSNRKLSKIDTLKLACAYINDLAGLLREHQAMQGRDLNLPATSSMTNRRYSFDTTTSFNNLLPDHSPPPYDYHNACYSGSQSQPYSPMSYQSSDSDLAYSPAPQSQNGYQLPVPRTASGTASSVNSHLQQYGPQTMSRASSDSVVVNIHHSSLASFSTSYRTLPPQTIGVPPMTPSSQSYGYPEMTPVSWSQTNTENSLLLH